MGYYEGKKIASHLGLFLDAARGQHGHDAAVIRDVARVLGSGHRLLGDKHFASLQAYVEGLRASTLLKLVDNYSYNPLLPLGKRVLKLELAYMGTAIPDNSRKSYYIPTTLFGFTKQDTLLFATRAYPMMFESEHIELRHIERAAKVFEWCSADTRQALAAGILIAQIMGNRMRAEGLMTCPVFLPDPRGLHMGWAHLTEEPMFRPYGYMAAFNHETRKTVYADTTTPLTTDDDARCYLDLETMVPHSKLSTQRYQVYSALMRVLQAPLAGEACTHVLQNFSVCGKYNLPDNSPIPAAVEKMKRDLEGIISSDLWQSCLRGTERHAPRDATLRHGPLDQARMIRFA